MTTVFFSWQSDTKGKIGRRFIEEALTEAIANLNQDGLAIDEPQRDDSIELDKDTKGIPGSPPIVATILTKIESASAFVADLTYVDSRRNGDGIPNPNVLIEYGWALKALTHECVIGVMNVAFGDPKTRSLPFDLRHHRHPIAYSLADDAKPVDIQRSKAQLVPKLKEALNTILSSRSTKAPLIEKQLLAAVPVADGPGRFRKKDEAIGVEHSNFHSSKPREIYLDEGPVTWLRVRPKYLTGRTLSTNEILRAISAFNYQLLLIPHSSMSQVRGVDGFGIFAVLSNSPKTPAVAYIFSTGEVWLCDVAEDRVWEGNLVFWDTAFFKAFENSLKFLNDQIKISPPYVWEAGIEGLKGLHIAPHRQDRMLPPGLGPGPSMKEVVTIGGEVTDPSRPANIELKPFVVAVYDAFGIDAPAWLFRSSAETNPI